jgi:ppGpp synthetase/RelA/SpoT-type nucleotidyltranferase
MPLGEQTTDNVYLENTRERGDQAQFQRLLDGMKQRGTAPPDEPPEPAQPTPAHDEQSSLLQRIGKGTVAVGKDVAKGALSAPGQVAEGYFDFWRNAGSAVGEFGDWLNMNAPEWLVGTPETQAADKARRQELTNAIAVNQGRDPNDPKQMELTAKNVLGIGGEADSVTGGLIRDFTKFMVGYRPFSKALAAAGVGSVAAMSGAGGLSMFLGNDPDKPNLTNMVVEKFPTLKGPVSEFLATDPNDNAAVNRLRNAVEGVATGVVAEGILRGIVASAKFTRSMLKAKGAQQAGIPGAPADAAAADAARHADDFVSKATGGVSPDAPALSVSVGAPAEGSATGVPLSTSLTVAPPGTQARPSQLSTLPPPSEVSISRTMPPSTRTGPDITRTKEPLPGWDEFTIGRPSSVAGKPIWQGTADHRAIIAEANKNVEGLKADLAQVVDGVEGARVFGARAKELKGVENKIATGRPPEAIGDYLGGRIHVDSPQAASDVLARLEDRFGKLLNVDDKIANPQYGYRAIHAQVEMRPGLTAEIQIVPKEIGAVQEKLHNLYDTIKRVDKSTLDEAGKAEVDRVTKQVADGFEEAWAKQHWPGPEAAAKEAKLRAEFGPSVPGQVTAKAIGEKVRETAKAVKLSDLNTNITWENIDKANIPGVIGDLAEQIKPNISEAKRGVLTLAAQKDMAEALNMTHDQFLARKLGEAYSGEQIIAAGRLLNSSHAKLLELAKIAELPHSSLADTFRVNEQMVTHMAILESFLGVSGEAGRALGALRAVHAEGNIARAQAMHEFLIGTGGVDGARNLSSMIIQMHADGAAPGAMNLALNRGWGRWAWDVYKEAYALSFLWKPVTQVRNLVGNSANAIWQSVDRKTAEKYSMVLGRDLGDGVVDGEAAAYMRGQLSAFKEAFRTAGRAVATGERQFAPLHGGSAATDAFGSGATLFSPSTSKAVAEKMGKSAVEQVEFGKTVMGRAIDFIGGTVRIPGRFLAAGDDFFKVIAFRGEIEAQAHRLALSEGLQGNAYVNRVTDLIANPPQNIKLSAMSHANYATFNDAPGALGQGLMNLRTAYQPIHLVMPYVRTPNRLLANAAEHSPLAFVIGNWRKDFAAGGAARDLALAKVTTGAAATSLLFDYAQNGNLSGPLPHEPAWRQSLEGAGIKPYSLQRPGGMQVGITGLGQLAPMIAFAGGLDQMMKNRDIHPEAYDTIDEWLNTAIAIMAYSFTDQTFMTSFSKMASGMDTYKRGSSGALGSYFRDLAGSAVTAGVPGLAPLRAIGSAMDPQQRQVGSWYDAVLFKNMPGLSDRLIPVRDVFGKEVENQPAGAAGALYNFFMPFRLSWKKDHATFNELVRLRSGIQRIEWSAPFMGVQVNFRDHPEVLDYYRRLAGNELQHNPKTGEKIGLEDFLNRMVSGGDPRYSHIYQNKSEPDGTGTDSGKAAYIKQWAQEYRTAAQRQIMSEAPWRFPEFYAEIQAGLAHREHQKLNIPYQGRGIEDRRVQRRTENVRPIQEPLPDRFGRPTGGGFRVPTQ